VADLKNRYVAKAKRLVVEKFPEMRGVRASVSEKRSHRKAKQSGASQRYVLTFEKEVSLPGGSKLKRLVRVTMDDTGEVVRLTSSK
jgi:hypothetical protein